MMKVVLAVLSATLLLIADGARICVWKNGKPECKTYCMPGEMEGRSFSYQYCKEEDQDVPLCSGVPVGPSTLIRFACDPDYYMKGSPTVSCSNPNPQFPTCERMCQPITPHQLDVVCMYEGWPVPCDEPLKQGTTVSADCKYPFVSDPVRCEGGGQLSGPLTQCRVDQDLLQAPNVTINVFNIHIQSDNQTDAIKVIQSILQNQKSHYQTS